MKHGIITTVNYEEGVVYCDVRALRMENSHDKVPVLKPHSGFLQVPKQGDKVAMDELDDGTLFITGMVSREDDNPDSMREGEMAFQLDADTKLRFSETNDGNYDVEVGASGDLSLSVSGDLDIDASGNVTVDSSSSVIIDGTPFSEHVHEYTDDETNDTGDGSGSSTTTTKTTDPPN